MKLRFNNPRVKKELNVACAIIGDWQLLRLNFFGFIESARFGHFYLVMSYIVLVFLFVLSEFIFLTIAKNKFLFPGSLISNNPKFYLYWNPIINKYAILLTRIIGNYLTKG